MSPAAPGASDRRHSTAPTRRFEAYLLEILSDFQVTIPELGTREKPPASRRSSSSLRTAPAKSMTR